MLIKKLEEISLERLYKINGLEDKEVVLEYPPNLWSSYKLMYKAKKGDIFYIGTKKLEEEITEKVCLDSEGLPYKEVSISMNNIEPIKFNSYEKIFLSNTSFASAMSHTHQKLLENIFGNIEDSSNPLYIEFGLFLNNFSQRIPIIREALQREKYFRDLTEIKKISETDLRIFYDIIGKREKIKWNDNNKKLAFEIWYRSYMDSKGYEEKITDYPKLRKKVINELLEKIIKDIESHGFKRVGRLTLD